MRTAKNRDQYINAWRSHIKELATLALAANIPYNEYLAATERLMQWLDQAADREFKHDDNYEV